MACSHCAETKIVTGTPRKSKEMIVTEYCESVWRDRKYLKALEKIKKDLKNG